MELTKENLFDGQDLNIDAVTDMIQAEPWRTREILEFISCEMKKEVEFKEKLSELKEEYEEKERALYEKYGVEYLDD